MTIREAIERADRLRPNTHEREDKLAWLTAVEANVARHMNLHENVDVALPVYTADTPEDTTLLLENEAGEVYVKYLVTMYDYYNGDYDRYNNAALMFNETFQEWKGLYRRTHMPKRFTGKENLV